MGDKKARVGAGDVKVVLSGEEFTLEPSLEACITISKMAGDSLVAAIQRCSRLDFEFVTDVLAVGMGATSPALKKQLREKVFRAGVISVAPDAILFVRTIMNGGKTPVDDEAANSLDLLDRLGSALPNDFADFFKMLEPLRAALIAKIEEVGDERLEAPLTPASQSRSENTTDD